MPTSNESNAVKAVYGSPSLYAKQFLYYCVCCGEASLAPGGTFSSPAGDGIIIVNICAGGATLATSGTGAFAEAGMTFAADCGKPFYLSAITDTRILFACVNGANTREICDFVTDRGASPMIRFEGMRDYCSRVSEILERTPVGADAELSACTHGLLTGLFEAALQKLSGQKPSVARVREYIDAHYSEDLNRAGMSDLSMLDDNDFGEAFRLSTGFTPYDYLITVRIAQARRLLLNTDMPVREVAAAVGYENTSSFSEIFAAKTGVSPSGFRKAYNRLTKVKDTAQAP